jgi:hypothetical protein
METKSQSDLLDLLRPLEEQLELLLPKPVKVEAICPVRAAQYKYDDARKEWDNHWAYMRTFPVEERYTKGLVSANWPLVCAMRSAESALAKVKEVERAKLR